MPALKSLTSRWQFSLGTLLAMMGWIAVVCIALKTPTQGWAATLFLLAFAAIMASLLGILMLSGRQRAFAIGYFAFSFGYVSCCYITERPSVSGMAAGQMPTSLAAAWAFQQLHKESVQTMTAPMGGGMGGYGGGVGGMGGGFGGGGFGGGGGFFSVDSSESAVNDDADAAAERGASDRPMSVTEAEGQGSAMPGSALGGDSGMGDPFGGNSGMGDPFGGNTSGMSAMPGMPGPGGAPAMTTYTVALYSQNNFVTIAHCLLTMLLGVVGGLTGQYFGLPGRETPRERPAPATTGT